MSVDPTRAVVVATSVQVTKEQAEEILPAIRARFSRDLTPDQAYMLARIAIAYGLDPVIGELDLYEGKPYVRYEGRLRLAHNHPAFAGIMARPADEAERQAYKCQPDDHLWVAEVYRTDWRAPIRGYGFVRPATDRNGALAKASPQWLAEKRAKARALRDAFHMPLPSLDDDDEPEPARRERRVDVETGEITEVRAGDVAGCTASQRQQIGVLRSQLSLSDADHRAALLGRYDVDSTMHLTQMQASDYIEALERELADRVARQLAAPVPPEEPVPGRAVPPGREVPPGRDVPAPPTEAPTVSGTADSSFDQLGRGGELTPDEETVRADWGQRLRAARAFAFVREQLAQQIADASAAERWREPLLQALREDVAARLNELKHASATPKAASQADPGF